MPSKNKTPNIGLNQWKGNEYAKREDFVNDNLIIDREIKDLQKKADEVEQNAKNYTDTTASKKVDKVAGKELSTEDYTTTDKNKLAEIQVGANKYVHPSKHSASIITQSATHRFTTDQEKAYWNGLESLLKAYADAATAGIVSSAPETLNNLNKIAQALNDDPDFANTISNQIKNKVDKVSGKKLSSNDYTTSDKNKLAGIATGANKYIHPSTHSFNIITETSDKKIMTNTERDKLNNIENNANKYIHPPTHNLNQITETSTKKIMTSSERNKLSSIQSGAQVNRAISSSVSSTSTTTNASSKAIKTTYDKAISALNTANGKEPKITKKSGFNLNKSDSVSSNSTSTLATSKAVKTAYDKGNSAYDKAVSANNKLSSYTIITKTSSGSFTVPQGVSALDLFIIGGGGGGAAGYAYNRNSTGYGGGGGSAGETIFKKVPVKEGQVIYFTIGAGGNGGVGNHSNGKTGGESLILGYICAGGKGGSSWEGKCEEVGRNGVAKNTYFRDDSITTIYSGASGGGTGGSRDPETNVGGTSPGGGNGGTGNKYTNGTDGINATTYGCGGGGGGGTYDYTIRSVGDGGKGKSGVIYIGYHNF